MDEEVNNGLHSWKIKENEFTRRQKVTLRHLLSHSAGFADDSGFAGYEPGSPLPTLAQMLRNEVPANNKKMLVVETVPGTRERYSGGGYLIIQQLIEDVSGKSFSSYVKEAVFDKIGMEHTAYEYYPDVKGQLTARGHDGKGNIDKKKAYHVYPELAAAGPWTTPTHLAKLIIEIQKAYAGTSTLLLSHELCKEMLKPQINFKGLGTHLTGAQRPEAFWHAGNNEGFTAFLRLHLHGAGSGGAYKL